MLRGLGVSLTEYNIKANPARDGEMKRMGGRGVPFILIGDRKISGYDPGAIISALDALKRKR